MALRHDILRIRLDEPWTECIACGAECVKAQGLPMYDGLFLEADAPGEWAGFDACRPCFDAYTIGGVRRLMFRLVRVAAIRDNERARGHYRTWAIFGGPMFTEQEIREWAADDC
jgi:hypothetical protein